jgi:Ca2+-binding EF-hand superfamily protein
MSSSSGIKYKGELLGKTASSATSKAASTAAKKSMEKCPVPHFPFLGKIHLTRPQSLMLFGFVTFGVILYGVFNERNRRARGIADAEKKILADQKKLVELIEEKSGGAGRKEGTSEDLASLVGKVSRVFGILDEDHSDSIDAKELQLMFTTTEAEYLMKDIDANHDGSISCQELIDFFLDMKDRSGLKQTMYIIDEYEAAARAKQDANSKLPQAALDSGVASAMASDNREAIKHLPRVWMPILVSRISAVFRRMDINNDGNIDGSELTALFDQDTKQDTKEQMANLMKDLHVADTNNDGMISATEFSRYFMDHINKRLIQIKAQEREGKAVDQGKREQMKVREWASRLLAYFEGLLDKRDLNDHLI